MIFLKEIKLDQLRHTINQAYRMDETHCVNTLLAHARFAQDAQLRIYKIAQTFVEEVRKHRLSRHGLDSFLKEYDLSTEEGITLMCLAEALLRIPDKETIDKLIRDKLTSANWQEHLGKSSSFFMNAATWGLVLSGKILAAEKTSVSNLGCVFNKLMKRSSEPVIRTAIMQAMKMLGKQFVLGRSIEEALKESRPLENKGYRYSYDMLGEAACTEQDAIKYYNAYQKAIEAIGQQAKGASIYERAGISVKLSALHPRYEFAKHSRVLNELVPRLKTLALAAKKYDIGLTVDAEEANRLDLSLDVIGAVFTDTDLGNWQGFGLALQAYQKRAWYVIDWLVGLARKHNRRWMVRLVKGAYWDSEIKWSQERGLENYPVFTRKINTDVSFIACAKKLALYPTEIYPQFATHNAQTVASVMEIMGDRRDYEFQCLHGMGRTLYDLIVMDKVNAFPCRIYAPVGQHQELLPYLVRRLLENGANTSFVNRIVQEDSSIADLIADPAQLAAQYDKKSHPKIPLPVNLYHDRKNSRGLDLTNKEEVLSLQKALAIAAEKSWLAKPTILASAEKKAVINPMDQRRVIGYVMEANEADLKSALTLAATAAFVWDKTSVEKRASYLEKAAQLFEEHYPEFLYLLIHEGGKCIPDAVAEVREACDFCRYYAAEARKQLAKPILLPGPVGEMNQLELCGRGPVLCISPWNFPLAIFTGQIVAALVAGNPVLAKPSHQTPLVAQLCVDLLHRAGIPETVLQLIPASGRLISEVLLSDERLKGVVMTGSTETAHLIHKTLANRNEIIPFIAETGGQNAMIVDSSALPEQVVADVLTSAFNSAGQRCSALRVLFLQEEIADKLIALLKGAMQELTLGDPSDLTTDIGPVIDRSAKEALQKHSQYLREIGKLIAEVPVPKELTHCNFFPPMAFEIPDLALLKHEVFGPILHVIRYKTKNLDKVIEAINNTHYGLTFGIHSRIHETVEYIYSRIRVGNCYVNRNMIGAVVGVQPFGGIGLSGTGPKAGGPHYLLRLTAERTLSINTAAAGGNTTLMTLTE